MVELKSHQIKPIKFLKNNFGIILYHSTGSGKTITSLSAMHQFDKEIVIVGPKSSKKAFNDEIERLGYDRSKFTIYTYAKMKNMIYTNEKLLLNKCVIIDEAHHLRSSTKYNILIYDGLKKAYRIIFLTATPIVNHLSDISILVNIIKKEDVLPTDPRLFNFLYFNEDLMQIENEKQLYEKLKGCISYYETKDNTNYPTSRILYMYVEMNNEQIMEYKKYVKKIIYEIKDNEEDSVNTSDIDASDIDIDFETIDLRKKNAFLSATRQLSNTLNGRADMPKIKAIYEQIKKGKFPAIVYSNYLKNGVYPLAKMLTSGNMTFKIITGDVDPDDVKRIVDSYNGGNIQVLLLTSAGSESLDLKNTRQIHIMEPHWNEAKIKQVIGRAIRYKSHISLPKEDQNVIIYRWISIFGKKYRNQSADEYLTQISEKKKKVYDAFKRIIIDSSIENEEKNLKGGMYYCRYLRHYNRYNKLKKLKIK